MIKQISLTLLIAALLTGCGGSDNDSDSNSSSSTPSSSSVASSSEAPSSVASSSAPASSEASSSESSAASSTPSADLSFGFEAGIDGWFVNGSENLIVTTELELSHDQINSALSIKPLTWVGDDYRRQARIALPGNPTLDNADIEVVINIPESYITDNTLTLQIMVDGPTADYGTYITMAELEAGDNTITVQRTVADATFLGIQLTTPPTTESILDAVLVKSVLIDLPEEGSSSSSSSTSSVSSASNQLSIPVDSLDGWSNDGTTATFSLDDGVSIAPDWSAAEQTAMYILSEPIDLTNATITYVIYVPEAYINDGAMVIQPFSQQNSGSYTGIFEGSIPGAWNPSSGLVAGDNTIIHGPFDTPPADIQRVGIKLQKQEKADGVTGNVIIRSITVNFPD
jgi:hypothetical protein